MSTVGFVRQSHFQCVNRDATQHARHARWQPTTSVGLKAFTHPMHVFVQIISMPNTFFDLLIGIFTPTADIMKHLFYVIIVGRVAVAAVVHLVVTQSRQVTIYRKAT